MRPYARAYCIMKRARAFAAVRPIAVAHLDSTWNARLAVFACVPSVWMYIYLLPLQIFLHGSPWNAAGRSKQTLRSPLKLAPLGKSPCV